MKTTKVEPIRYQIFLKYLIIFTLTLVIAACQDDEVPPPPPPQNECQDSVSFSNILITPHSDNSLRFNLTFQTSEAVQAHVKYWLSDDSTQVKHSALSPASTQHNIDIINMIAESEYHYQIVTRLDTCDYASDIHTFTSGELPFQVPQLTLHNTALDFDGYIMAHTSAPGALFAIDHRGNIVWYQAADQLIKVHTLSPKNTIAVMLGSLDYIEMDYLGNPLRHYKYGMDFQTLIHHELLQTEEDDIFTLGIASRNYDLTSVGGSASEQVISDDIIKFAPDGSETWRWSLLDHANPLDDPNILNTRTDWTHSNALTLDTDGHLLLSVRFFNQIWKINIQDGSVIWKLGINGDFSMNPDDYFYRQHAVHLTPDGDIMLYDNGLADTRATSRALVFDINENDMTATTTVKVELPDTYFSHQQSNCMMTDNDKILFANSVQRALIITDLDGDFLWHVEVPRTFYRAYFVEGLGN